MHKGRKMKISAKVEYACRALIELGLHWPNKNPLPIALIGQRQGIPGNFLTHILISLKQLGFVDSTRGKSGGYFLIKPPAQITLKEVIVHFCGLGILFPGNYLVGNPGQAKRVTDQIWQEIDRDIFKKLNTMTLLTICDRVRNQNKTLVYDI